MIEEQNKQRELKKSEKLARRLQGGNEDLTDE